MDSKKKWVVAEFTLSKKAKLTGLSSIFIGEATESDIDEILQNSDQLTGRDDSMLCCCPVQNLEELIEESKKVTQQKQGWSWKTGIDILNQK